ncbi:unnamed protein product, partial [Choristocarpus tenellus]
GVSFNDNFARGVFCIGYPLPSIGDPKVQCKKDYNEWKLKEAKRQQLSRPCSQNQSPMDLLSGDEWYHQQADRALNQ